MSPRKQSNALTPAPSAAPLLLVGIASHRIVASLLLLLQAWRWRWQGALLADCSLPRPLRLLLLPGLLDCLPPAAPPAAWRLVIMMSLPKSTSGRILCTLLNGRRNILCLYVWQAGRASSTAVRRHFQAVARSLRRQLNTEATLGTLWRWGKKASS